jgi:DNA-binding GntR family transcriptional regulator
MTKTSPRAESAYQALRRAIIEQALAPGTKLPEDEIGAHFAMSRTLVRATLARLQAEGLVDTRPKRSATVAQPTLKEAKEIFAMRRVLEREAVRLALAEWRPEFGAILQGCIREEQAAVAEGDARVSGRLAGEFHIAMAALTDNALLRRYLGELVSRCSLILALYGRPHAPECSINEHQEIVDALRARDAAKAVALMEQHLGLVEGRALQAEGAGAEPALGDVLGKYASALAARGAAVELRKAKRRGTK